MTAKFTIRSIQQGQAQKANTVTAGAGQNGQALVLQAVPNTRYQLADALTFASPSKLQLKRVGKDLLVALPGNDVSSPDIVIRDYFEFEGMSLSGINARGQPMVYDTVSGGFFSAINPGPTLGVTAQSMATNQTSAASLTENTAGWFDSGWGLAALGGGALVVAAASSKSGGGAGGSQTPAGITKIAIYKGDPTKPVPTVTDFTGSGVTGVSEANITGLTTLISRTQLPLDSASSVQSLVNSFNKVLAEANGTNADVSPDSDPNAADYTHLLGANTPASVGSGSGNKTAALALLNDRVKALNTTEVDTYSEINALAVLVESVSQLAQTPPSSNGTSAAGITQPQLTSLGVDVAATSLSAVSDAIRASADDLSSLNTTAKLKALVVAYNTILAEANGTSADTTVANPSAADYAAIGADIGAAKTDATALARLNAIVGNLSSSAVDTVGEIAQLSVTLDKIQTVAALATGAALTDAQKFSVDELKNLGLSGFVGSEVQNTALALKVSEAIRDKALAEVDAGTGTGFKLVDGIKTAIDQTQLERLQSLVSQEIIKNFAVDSLTPSNSTTAPTLSDWQNIGVFKPLNDGSGKAVALNSTELAYLNSAADKLAAAQLDTPAKAQAVFEAYARIVQEANGSSTDSNTSVNPSSADLALVGVTGGATESASQAAGLLLDILANRSSDQVDTVGELQALADTVSKLVGEAAATAAGTVFTTTELGNLGLRGVSATAASANLADFLSHVRGSSDTGSDINTLGKLQALLSLAVVQAWARDVNPDNTSSPAVAKTAATPTPQDYKDIGVLRTMPKDSNGADVTALIDLSFADVRAINDAIDTVVDNSSATTTDDALINTTAKVKAIAASYLAILNEANGSSSNFAANTTTNLNPDPVAADYQRIGVTGSFADDTSTDGSRTLLLSSLVGEKNFGQVDTVKEIQVLATAVGKVLALAEVANSSSASAADAAKSLTLDELSNTMALVGVNEANLGAVNLAIQNADVGRVDSLNELQSLLSLTRISRYAGDNATGSGGSNAGGLPTFFDWSSIKDTASTSLTDLSGELEANVGIYNKALDAKAAGDVDSFSELQSLVSVFNGYVVEWAKVVDTGNAGFAADLFLSASQTGSALELAARAAVAGKLIDLAERGNGIATTNTSGAPFNFTGTDLTKDNLTSLGLDTSKIGNGSGTNDANELGNIWVAIQNSDPSQVTSLSALQGIVNTWAVL